MKGLARAAPATGQRRVALEPAPRSIPPTPPAVARAVPAEQAPPEIFSSIPPSPPVVFARQPRRFLLIVNASHETVPFAKHLGEGVDVVAIGWHPRSSIDVKDALWWQERNPRHRKFLSVPTLLGGQFDLPYEAIGVVDDDVEPHGCTWTDIFELGLSESFDVFHPALTQRSFIAHEILKREPAIRCKRANYCDLIAVCFRREAFSRCAPHFLGAGVFSWGLPVFWGQTERLGILDHTPVAHMRPVASGTVYRGVGTHENGIEGLHDFVLRHGLREAPHSVWERKTMRGAAWSKSPPLAPRMTIDECNCVQTWDKVRYYV